MDRPTDDGAATFHAAAESAPAAGTGTPPVGEVGTEDEDVVSGLRFLLTTRKITMPPTTTMSTTAIKQTTTMMMLVG